MGFYSGRLSEWLGSRQRLGNGSVQAMVPSGPSVPAPSSRRLQRGSAANPGLAPRGTLEFSQGPG